MLLSICMWSNFPLHHYNIIIMYCILSNQFNMNFNHMILLSCVYIFCYAVSWRNIQIFSDTHISKYLRCCGKDDSQSCIQINFWFFEWKTCAGALPSHRVYGASRIVDSDFQWMICIYIHIYISCSCLYVNGVTLFQWAATRALSAET